MVRRLHAFVSLAGFGATAVALLTISGCTVSNAPLTSQSSTVVISTMTPPTVTLMPNQTQQFTVSVSGASDTAIAWDIVDATGQSHFGGDSTVGTINASGLYTAPAQLSSSTTLTLYAGAAADTSISRQSTITLNPAPPPVSVLISPQSANAQICPLAPCSANSLVTFTPTVSNAANTALTWEVNGLQSGNSQIGTVSASGVYTAPASVPNPAAVTVKAVSVQDPTKSGSATVTIISPGTVAIAVNPTSAPLFAGGTQNFSATVTGSPDTAVTWTATCSQSNCGTLTLTGNNTATYNAPPSVSSTLSVSVTATADADPTKTSSSSVTVSSPLQPMITFTYNTSQLPLHAAGSPFLITAQVVNLPQGVTPQFTWASPASQFCISSDEEGLGAYDNCTNSDGGDPTELDGPGTLTPLTTAQTSYSPPDVVFTGSLIGNLCPQATAATPYVNIPVSADLSSGTILTANLCIEVLP